MKYTFSDAVYALRMTSAVSFVAENECVGSKISEMMLIDSEGDPICFLNFLPKQKDDIKETYRIRNHYS